ncbi:CAP domain-containing protein [Piscinibacter sakaiensis]|uniref:SCP domain-containing protein n=1 Tax=Piscinibacter sakaiensis TaxID=1547922 RepID=A0A0K8P543_PISS1|nr:CAP domain-containing protein [Piscinibacter sakaiensis]GAP37644.1 hypothetical protein ISF6_3589 [Piscinibacter sakaiensis]
MPLAGALLLALAACGSPRAPAVASPGPVPVPGVCPALPAGAQAVVDELNLARAQPQAYAQLVAQHYASLGRDRVFTRGELRVQMTEGRPAVDEAIAYLKRAAPQPPLVADACLSDAAQAHALDLGRGTAVGHVGSDRSQPSERASRRLGRPTACGENLSQGPETARDHVIALIVDDGVASRAHRTNVFGADYRRVGVGLATHPVFRTVNVNLLCRDAML